MLPEVARACRVGKDREEALELRQIILETILSLCAASGRLASICRVLTRGVWQAAREGHAPVPEEHRRGAFAAGRRQAVSSC
jgi:hypothetical protein